MQAFTFDTSDVGQAAGFLDVSEFRVFELAYVLWFGHDPTSREIDRLFSDYLHRDVVPYWVRDMARKVTDKCMGGSCRPEDFGVTRPRSDPDAVTRGLWLIIAFFIGLSAFFYMAVNSP